MALRDHDKRALQIIAGYPKAGASLHILRVEFEVRNAAADDSLRGSLRRLVAQKLAVRDLNEYPMTFKITDAGRAALKETEKTDV